MVKPCHYPRACGYFVPLLTNIPNWDGFDAKGTRMRIRWTTRIAMAVGVITLIAGIAAGTGATGQAAAPRHAAQVSATH